MRKLNKIQNELECVIDEMFKDTKVHPEIKYRARHAYLMLGKFFGESPVKMANDLDEQLTLQMLEEADGTKSSKNRLEGINPEYVRIIAGKKTRLSRSITTATQLKWVLLCWVLLHLERLRPERR
ncbi:hypothetical protein ACS87_08850 [Vibrio parahaemolyticus]|uniref:hypothetical protein n=1 Tax=Vibrio parahaemolyticus TaxID=670 RepID=UPI0006A56F8B|nr:hypothetical protein [Vibrio parahaemolyticus]KOE77586.1 hypothetical protein ACS87_08850 [Vibrio parahaemolyticus]